MFNGGNRVPDGAGKGSAIYQGISAIGTALGIGAAILVTPIVFGWTKEPLYSYLSETWRADVSLLLTWAFAAVEAFTIYGSTKLLFTLLTVWSTAALAARRFPGS